MALRFSVLFSILAIGFVSGQANNNIAKNYKYNALNEQPQTPEVNNIDNSEYTASQTLSPQVNNKNATNYKYNTPNEQTPNSQVNSNLAKNYKYNDLNEKPQTPQVNNIDNYNNNAGQTLNSQDSNKNIANYTYNTPNEQTQSPHINTNNFATNYELNEQTKQFPMHQIAQVNNENIDNFKNKAQNERHQTLQANNNLAINYKYNAPNEQFQNFQANNNLAEDYKYNEPNGQPQTAQLNTNGADNYKYNAGQTHNPQFNNNNNLANEQIPTNYKFNAPNEQTQTQMPTQTPRNIDNNDVNSFNTASSVDEPEATAANYHYTSEAIQSHATTPSKLRAEYQHDLTATRIEYWPPAKYEYSYSVNDAYTGDTKSHSESSDGYFVQGSYSVVDPDGYERIVTYTADDVNGFNAVVSRKPYIANIQKSIPDVEIHQKDAPELTVAPKHENTGDTDSTIQQRQDSFPTSPSQQQTDGPYQ